MIRTEKGRKLALCDNCEDLFGIFETFEEAKQALDESNWITRKVDGHWINLCPECQ